MQVLTNALPQDATCRIHDIMNSYPLSYPDNRITDKDRDKAHSVYGRSFELSLLCFAINGCDYCGNVEPTHVDPDLKKMLHFHLHAKRVFPQ